MPFELLAARRVLAVQPHYDDNDIAAAGTLCLLARAGARVVYVTVTDDLAGVLDPDLPDDAARAGLIAEQHAAARIVGVAEQHWLEWPDAGGLDQVVVRDQVIDLIRAERPDVVMTVDPWLAHEAHSDHVRTSLAVCEAVLLAGLPRVRRDPARAPHSVSHVALCFTDAPNTSVDTSAVQHERHAALDCYRMQFDDAGLDALHRALDGYERAAARDLARATHAESFNVLPASALHVGLGRRPPRSAPSARG